MCPCPGFSWEKEESEEAEAVAVDARESSWVLPKVDLHD